MTGSHKVEGVDFAPHIADAARTPLSFLIQAELMAEIVKTINRTGATCSRLDMGALVDVLAGFAAKGCPPAQIDAWVDLVAHMLHERIAKYRRELGAGAAR